MDQLKEYVEKGQCPGNVFSWTRSMVINLHIFPALRPGVYFDAKKTTAYLPKAFYYLQEDDEEANQVRLFTEYVMQYALLDHQMLTVQTNQLHGPYGGCKWSIVKTESRKRENLEYTWSIKLRSLPSEVPDTIFQTGIMCLSTAYRGGAMPLPPHENGDDNKLTILAAIYVESPTGRLVTERFPRGEYWPLHPNSNGPLRKVVHVWDNFSPELVQQGCRIKFCLSGPGQGLGVAIYNDQENDKPAYESSMVPIDCLNDWPLAGVHAFVGGQNAVATLDEPILETPATLTELAALAVQKLKIKVPLEALGQADRFSKIVQRRLGLSGPYFDSARRRKRKNFNPQNPSCNGVKTRKTTTLVLPGEMGLIENVLKTTFYRTNERKDNNKRVVLGEEERNPELFDYPSDEEGDEVDDVVFPDRRARLLTLGMARNQLI